VEESLLRADSHRQWFKVHDAKEWKREDVGVAEFQSVDPIPVRFLEQYFVLIEANFAAKYFEKILTDAFVSQNSDYGPDQMWCGAAADKTYGNSSILSSPCSLIPVISLHEDTRQIHRVVEVKGKEESGGAAGLSALVFGGKKKERDRHLSEGFAAKAAFVEDALFRSWIEYSEAYRGLIGMHDVGESYLKTLRERCGDMRSEDYLHPRPDRNFLTDCFKGLFVLEDYASPYLKKYWCSWCPEIPEWVNYVMESKQKEKKEGSAWDGFKHKLLMWRCIRWIMRLTRVQIRMTNPLYPKEFVYLGEFEWETYWPEPPDFAALFNETETNVNYWAKRQRFTRFKPNS